MAGLFSDTCGLLRAQNAPIPPFPLSHLKRASHSNTPQTQIRGQKIIWVPVLTVDALALGLGFTREKSFRHSWFLTKILLTTVGLGLIFINFNDDLWP